MNKRMLIMDTKDNVGVALEDVQRGDTCVAGSVCVQALEDVMFCHKIALCDIPLGADILKYGQKIGYATAEIRKGQWLHDHNVVSERGR